ncbi:MAG TPA: hypothetical protein VN729_04315 [Ktedonobacteraceae bacterium]|nr:hypothetical protein [Ktedonobacteraceae bacterium]
MSLPHIHPTGPFKSRACGAFIFFLVRRGMGYAHTSPHQKENERAAGQSWSEATFQ